MTNVSNNSEPARLTDTQMSVLSAAAALNSEGVVIPGRLRGKAAQSLADSLINKGLLRVLAYRMQSDAYGDLSRGTRRMLDRLWPVTGDGAEGARTSVAPPTAAQWSLKSGTLLSREWQGRMERVMVLDDGFAWNGAAYASLSAVALAISGTKWNGYRFFGLRNGRAGPVPLGARR